MLFDFLKEIIQRNILIASVLIFILGFLGSFLFFTLRKSKNISISTSPTAIVNEPKSEIVVDLSGAVVTPGIYALPADSRVGDLVNMGGGVLDNASLLWVSKNVNLSQKLVDSQKIYIPFEWEFYEQSKQSEEVLPLYYKKIVLSDTAKESTGTSSTGNSSSGSTLINVNTASSQELDSLSGIGPTYAQRIIDNRTYADFEEFLSKSTLSSSVCEKIKDYITF